MSDGADLSDESDRAGLAGEKQARRVRGAII